MKRLFILFFLCFGFLSAKASDLPNFTKLIEEQAKTVVRIDARSDQSQSLDRREQIDLFRYFFENPYGDRGLFDRKSRPRKQHGSGFIIESDGYVLTNAHVVDGADNITVTTSNQKEYKAELIGSDKRSDIAVLKIKDNNLPVVNIGNSEKVKVGEWVLAIGNPFGFDYTATKGIVSAVSRSLPDGTYVPFIQTDAAVNPGNSGGPLFNLKGEVIGINSQIYSNTGSFNGLAFAIPINVAIDIVEQIKDKGFVSRGWLGVAIQGVSYDLAKSFGLEDAEGALISNVIADSPAEKAGLKAGDIILKFGDKKIKKSTELPPAVALLKDGDKVSAEILRNGKKDTINIVIGSLDEDIAVNSNNNKNKKYRGLNVSSIPESIKNKLKLDKGVFVKNVLRGSRASESGFIGGDIIISIDGKEINNIKEFRKKMKSIPEDKPIAILVNRQGNNLYIALK